MDLLLDAVCVVDAEGRYVFVNAACERLFGYTRDELIGRNMIELVHPEDRERTLQAAANVMRGTPHLHFENRYVRKDGQVVHIMWSARWSETDRMRLAVARDVTELKRTEQMQGALHRILEAAHAAEGVPELCQRVHRIVGDLLPADNFFVALYDEATDTVSFPYHVDEHGEGSGPQPLIAGNPLAEVIRGGQPLLLTHGGDGAHWLGAPLISAKGVMGALVVRRHSGRGYTEEHKGLLHFLSGRVAAAIERKQTEARLHHLAWHDALTALPNRTLFDERFDTALRRARRYSEHLALLFVDLNDFKYINDNFGHEAGDRLLREVAQRIVRCVRAADTVARIGGDEFTVLLTNIHGPEDIEVIAHKVSAAISVPFELDGRTLEITASIGAAVYPEHGDSREQLFRSADAGMYATKRAAV